jgi:hypothetical protein
MYIGSLVVKNMFIPMVVYFERGHDFSNEARYAECALLFAEFKLLLGVLHEGPAANPGLRSRVEMYTMFYII